MERDYTKAVIYCRVSSEKQVKEGNGLDSQEHRCNEYASSLGLTIEKVFRDEGISGGLFDRPAMKALIGYLDAHWEEKYFVIFDDLKRFARDVEVHLKLKAELKAREAKLRCLNYNFDDSAEGEFVETIFAAQNQLERKQNRRQVCQKMKARIERGYWCFCPPTGYKYERDKDHGKLLVPNHPISNIIQEGLMGFAEDSIKGQMDLLNYFKSQNLHGLLGKKTLYIQFIRGVLSNPLYAGFIEFADWDIKRRKGHHKPLISEETHKRILNKIKRPERIPRDTDKLEYPLRQVISCAFCGKPMTASCNRSKNPKKYYPHYTCNNKNCTANPKNITASKVEEDYIKLLESIKVDEKLLKMAEVVAKNLWERKIKELNLSQENKEIEISQIEKQIEEFLEIIPTTRSESVRMRYEQKIEELDKRVHELKNGIDTQKMPNFDEALKLTLKFLGTPAETWKKPDRNLKIMVHKMIFRENPKYSLQTGFGTPKLSLPFSIKEYFGGNNDDLVEVEGVAPSSKRLKTYILQAYLR